MVVQIKLNYLILEIVRPARPVLDGIDLFHPY